MCTAMLYDPVEAAEKQRELAKTVVTPEGELQHTKKREFKGNFKLFERWIRFKQYVLLGGWKRDDSDPSDKKKSILSLFFFW